MLTGTGLSDLRSLHLLGFACHSLGPALCSTDDYTGVGAKSEFGDLSVSYQQPLATIMNTCGRSTTSCCLALRHTNGQGTCLILDVGWPSPLLAQLFRGSARSHRPLAVVDAAGAFVLGSEVGAGKCVRVCVSPAPALLFGFSCRQL